MATTEATPETEGAIWSRLLAPANGLSIQAARSILQMDFPAEDKKRMHILAVKAREGNPQSI
jgi:hypothetical protein